MTAVGVFGIGLAAYWPQFDGPARSASRATSGASRSASRELGGEVVSAGLVDTDAGRARGGRPLRAPRRSTSCSATPSPTPPRARCSRWRRRRRRRSCCSGLQPTPTLDYANTDTGEWLANCAACCVPEIAGAFTRARIPYDTVAGTIDDDERAWAKIGAWVRAAGVARALRALAHRLPRARLSGDARHVHRLHRGARADRRARRGARDRRPRRARRAGDRRRGRRQGRRRSARCSRSPTRPTDPIAGPDRAGAARLVGARRGRPRPARRRLRARRADLLLPRRRRQRGRAARRRRDRRQLAADRARRSRPRARATSRPTSPS